MYENVQENERKERERQWRREGEAKRQGINTLFSGEALFGPLAHTRTHTNKQVTHTHTHAQSTNVYLSF